MLVTKIFCAVPAPIFLFFNVVNIENKQLVLIQAKPVPLNPRSANFTLNGNVQFQIINEFEQAFSAAKVIECYDRSTLREVSDTLNRSTVGTDTLHLVVRGSAVPVIGLAIDSVPFGASNGISGNEPSLQGGRSATVVFP